MKMLNARFVSKLKLVFLPLLLWTPILEAQSVAPVAPDQARPKNLAYAAGWSRNQSLSAIASFDTWANQFVKASPALSRVQASEGLALASQRRAALAGLIKSDPEKALASAVPAAVREQLPAEIAAQLETRVSGIGDFSVRIFCPAKGGPSVPPIQRLVSLDGQVYEAHVYGRRASQTSKQGIPLHGIVLDGVLALHEGSLREFESGETAEAGKSVVDLRTVDQQGKPSSPGRLTEIGGTLYRFASSDQVLQAEARLEAAEAGIDPVPTQAVAELVASAETSPILGKGPIAAGPPSAWTTGLKKILIIRVDFSDITGDPIDAITGNAVTAAYAQNLADTQVVPYYIKSSYGLTSMTNTVTTQLYRMPKTAVTYATTGDNTALHADAETLAAADYTLANYDRIVVLFANLGGIPGSFITYGGLADVVGKKVWANGEFDFRVVAHELGHTYGLYHAGLWQVTDGNPISAVGSVIEYGDDYDTMGANYANDPNTDFSPYFKNILGWLPDSKVRTISTSGIYRVHTFDWANAAAATNDPILALRFVKDSTRTYWIGVRRNFTSNNYLSKGAYITWGYNSVGGGGGGGFLSGLLDLNTPGITPPGGTASDEDAALAVGATFADPAVGLSIIPIAQGNSLPNDYLDFQIGPGISQPDLVVLTNYLTGGNGNGLIDPNECNSLDIVLTNIGSTNASGLQTTLYTTTPGVLIAQKFSAFPDILTNAAGTNLTSFKISTSPLFVCGSPVDLGLVIKSDQVVTTNFFRVNTTAPGPVVRFDNSSPVVIPDADPLGTNSMIIVSNINSAVFKVSVALNILHTFDADLSLELIGPDGTKVSLARNRGGSDNNYGLDCFSDLDRTIFDDGASNSIAGANAPFVGTFQPEEALSAFSGKTGTNVNGGWLLHVVDDAQPDFGFIQCWTLNVQTSACVDGGGQCPGADLAVGIKSIPDRGTIGSNLTYIVTVTNNGPDNAKAVALNQSLPSSVLFVSASSSQGTVTHSGSTVSCNLGNLDVGATATMTVVVLPTTPGTIFSTASVGAIQADPDLSNNSATLSTLIEVPTADLAVALVGNPNPALLGGVLTYTVTVTNNGPSAASGVAVSNSIPASTILISAVSSVGSISGSGNTIVANLGTLAKSGSAILTISVRPTVLGSITAVSKVSAIQLDPLPANNTATLVSQVGPASDLLVTMTSQPSSTIVGNNITYQINVLNLGPIAATGVNLNDTLPLNTSFVSATPSQGSSTFAGNILNCALGNLNVGASATISLVVGTASLPVVPVTLTNRAIATADQPDPDAANNTVSVMTIVDNPTNRIVAAGTTLTSESFTPNNGAIDPGETVTVTLGLQNTGNINGGSLTATLLATNGVTTNSPQVQNYGVLLATAAPTFRTFTFTANGTNGGPLTATLQLQDGINALQPVTFSFTLPTITRFSNTADIKIPSSGAADPYPSTINVSGLTNPVGKVTVTVTNFDHTFSDDVAMLLVGPAGSGSQKVVLLSHVGDNVEVVNASLTFDDSAASELSVLAHIASGTYKPSAKGTVAWPTNTPAGPYGAALSAFNGTSANGTWSLYVYDGSPGDAGTIFGGWSLAVTTVKPVNQIADLSLTGTVAPLPILAGSNLAYTFTITNSGPNPATGIAFTNPVPAGATFVSASSTRGAATTNLSGKIYCNFTNSLAVGSNATITVVVIPQGGTTSLTSQAAVLATETDLNLLNNSVTLVTPITTPQADLVVAMTGAPNPVIVGSNLTYTITVTNNGPNTALGVVITNQLPAGITFVPGASSSSFGLVTNIGGVVTCNVGNLASGSNGFITVATIPQQAGSITNRVGVRTDSNDTNLGNNSASVVVTATTPAPMIVVSGATMLAESKVPGNQTIDPGETVTIAFSLANIGQINTANLVATLQVGGGVSSPSSPQTFGALIHGGAAVTQPFAFTGNGGNGGVVIATLQLQDGGNNLGTVSFNFSLPATNAYSNAAAITIPANGAATPYASTLNVSGVTGLVSKVTITLSNLSHAFPDDIDILLVSPSGQKTLVMSDAGGGYAITNVTLTLDDDASSVLPDVGPLVSGTFRPSDYETGDIFPPPAPSGPYVTSLAALNGADPNGTWSLYVVDDSVGDAGSIASGWSLSIETVNSVNAVADLGITIASPAGQITAGNNFAYTLTVTNRGPAAASGVVVTDTLPEGLTYVSASTPVGPISPGSPITLNLGSIAAGGSTTATLTLNASAAGIYTNLAVVTANETDLNLANNIAQITTGVINFTTATLGNATVHNDGSFTLILTGQPGQVYVIQASTNLTSWIPVSTITASSIGKFQYTDTNAASFGRRFYRAALQSAP